MKYVNSRMENGEIKILYRDLITKENTGLNTAEKGAGDEKCFTQDVRHNLWEILFG